MLFRIQADADSTGLIVADSIQVFDASVLTDPVTDEVHRGSPREVKLSIALRQSIASFLNTELGGTTKAAERLAVAREDNRVAKLPKP